MQFLKKKWLDINNNEKSHRLDDWVEHNTPGGSDLLLQMDIEGAEYRNFLNVSDATLSRFRIIVVELHGLAQLADPCFLRGVFTPSISRLTRGFQVVHAHANNCCGQVQFAPNLSVPRVLELTLLRRDRVGKTTRKLVLPNPLDAVNTLRKPPLHLQGLWLQHADPISSTISALTHSKRYLEWACQRLQEHNKALNQQISSLQIENRELLSNPMEKSKSGQKIV
jgi:hypothetical protein